MRNRFRIVWPVVLAALVSGCTHRLTSPTGKPDAVRGASGDPSSNVPTEEVLSIREGMVGIPELGVVEAPHTSDAGTPRVHVSAFQIDRTEVTAGAFGECVRAGACARPWPYRNQYGDIAVCNYGKSRRANHPMNCIGPSEASAYCAWALKRLPTSEEWEHAARGRDEMTYPWGEGRPRTYETCWDRPTGLGTCAVGAHPHDRSPFGVLDMAGNVAEWTRGSGPIVDPQRFMPFFSVHGGSYFSNGADWSPGGYLVQSSDVRPFTGFRCAADLPTARGDDGGAGHPPARQESTRPGAACDAPMSKCDGLCVDLHDDNGHCGGCDVICDGTCFERRCIVEFATTHGTVGAITVTGGRALWRSYGSRSYSIVSKPVMGGDPSTLFTGSGIGNDGPIVADTKSVYWAERAEHQAVHLLGLATAGGSIFTLATAPDGVMGLALDDSDLYWTTDVETSRVMRVSRTGGVPQIVATHAGAILAGIVLDDSHAYAMSGSIEARATRTWFSVLATPKRGGVSASVRGWGEGGIGSLAADATAIYWPSGEMGSEMMRLLRRGGRAVVLAASQNRISSVAVDATSLYWTTEGECRSATDCDGTIMKATPK